MIFIISFVYNKKFWNHFCSFLLIIATLFMSIGYASINSIGLDIAGELAVAAPECIFISEIDYLSSVGADVESSKITKIDYSVMNLSIVLSESDVNSNITYTITIYNNTKFDYKFVGITYDDNYYDNKNIVSVLSNNLQVGDVLSSGNTVTFNITFKYSDLVSMPSLDINKLNAVINFDFDYIERILNYSDPLFDDSGMIPVVISDNGVVTTADLDTDWYSYGEKRWANMVLVTESSRDKYLGLENVEITDSDILAYYVWIPRYSYKIWDDNAASNTSSPQSIDIVFEGINTISNGTKIDEYRTSPAFWWDKDSDGARESGEEISGVWVGKFETAKGSSSNVGTSMPVVLPNLSSWISQTVSNQFKTILNFSGGSINASTGMVSFAGSSVYGLSSITDSHMMKNGEWGAVSYLAHSKYGLDSEIRINNYYKNSSFLTGCGASSENQGSSTSCGIIYGEASDYPQSTTGNISGVFDMSGGAWDRVMGNYNNVKGSSEFSPFPEKKYYDVFSLSSLSACTVEICGGHALFETSEWYNDLSNFISNNNYPWIVRSGGYGDGDTSGSFNFGRNVGQASGLSSMRAVLIVAE